MSKKQSFQVVVSCLLVSTLCLSGCRSQDQCKLIFQNNLADSIEAVKAGDLQGAKQSLEAGCDCAKEYEQQRLCSSMEELIAGAQYMMDGQVAQAKTAWSNIADPHLSRQVRVKASAVMDLEVPMVPAEKRGQP